MGIEKDIQQASFANSHHKSMVNLMYTYGWMLEKIRTVLSEEDITHQQFNILRILRGSFPKPLSTLQIRERMLDKMSDTSRIVERLLTKELVKKTICSQDKRLVDVVITDRGQELLKKIDSQNDFVGIVMNGLTEKEADQLSNLLDKLRSNSGI